MSWYNVIVLVILKYCVSQQQSGFFINYTIIRCLTLCFKSFVIYRYFYTLVLRKGASLSRRFIKKAVKHLQQFHIKMMVLGSVPAHVDLKQQAILSLRL